MNAQVTVGSEANPVSGSLLDLKQNGNLGVNSNKGLGLPRVMLEDVLKMGPCIDSDIAQQEDKDAHIGLMVYNLKDSLKVGLCQGVYVWGGDIWTRIPTPCSDGIAPELLYSPNCYIVPPEGTSEEIPVAKAYLVSEYRDDIPDLNRDHKVSLKVLWQDIPDLIENDGIQLVNGDKGIYTKFKIKATAGKEGNALVALHVGTNGDDSDPICWAWHIWVTDYDPNTATPTDYGQNAATNGSVYKQTNGERDYLFMDRNLGALNITPTDLGSMGLMYQWGRKDPFPAADGNWTDDVRTLYEHKTNANLTEINEATGDGGLLPPGSGIKHLMPPSSPSSNLALSIENPTTFYYGSYIKGDSEYLFDWYSGDASGSNSDNQLWGTSDKKSPFDPCPRGWRVPAESSSKSPWDPYVNDYSNGPFGKAGVNTVGSNGFNIIGNASRPNFGYYAAGFPRSPKAFRGAGGVVGSDTTYPTSAGGTFWVFGYVTVQGQDQIEAYYWTSSTANNITASSMLLNIGGMGGTEVSGTEIPKATGAFVRCVKE
ncbi:MAG: hypothetical protein LBV43_11695 [Prevotella sp.]|nr:hypothetical protein [Prevotella sp.]